jgi:hypothetical protein
MGADVRSLVTVSRVVVTFLIIQAVWTVVRIASMIGEIDILTRIRDHGSFTLAEAAASDQRVQFASRVGVALFLATAIVWLVWQHRAHANVRAFGVGGLDVTPGWGVGWWFVPFANLVKPFQTVRELWKASDPDPGVTGWATTPTWPVISLWWATYLAANLIQSAARAGRTAPLTADSGISSDRTSMLGYVALIVSAFLAVAVVRGVSARQVALQVRIPPAPPRPDQPSGRPDEPN